MLTNQLFEVENAGQKEKKEKKKQRKGKMCVSSLWSCIEVTVTFKNVVDYLVSLQS